MANNKLTFNTLYKTLFRGKKKRSLAYYLFALMVLGLFIVINNSQAQNALENIQPGFHEVISVNDGDTITVLMSGEEQIIRLIGVDTPETHHPEKPVQCFGQAASDFTTKLIGENSVRLEADPESDNRDIYSRLLRYVYLPDDTLVNAEIIAQGYGFAPSSFLHGKLEEFEELEKTAKEEKLGLWNGCELEVNQYGSYETVPAKLGD